jgi:hypothetical protein
MIASMNIERSTAHFKCPECGKTGYARLKLEAGELSVIYVSGGFFNVPGKSWWSEKIDFRCNRHDFSVERDEPTPS